MARLGNDEEQRATKGSVILLSKEEDPNLILRPKLEEAGAVLKRVHFPGYGDPNDPTSQRLLNCVIDN
jgi:hypothetical protein